jgi:hypothetical protein
MAEESSEDGIYLSFLRSAEGSLGYQGGTAMTFLKSSRDNEFRNESAGGRGGDSDAGLFPRPSSGLSAPGETPGAPCEKPDGGAEQP